VRVRGGMGKEPGRTWADMARSDRMDDGEGAVYGLGCLYVVEDDDIDDEPDVAGAGEEVTAAGCS